MKTSNNILLIGGAIAAYFLLKGSSGAGGGTGGSLSIPDTFGNSSGTGSAAVSPVTSGTSGASLASSPSFQISPVILAAMNAKKVNYSAVPAAIPALNIGWDGSSYTSVPGSSSQLHGVPIINNLGFGFDANTNMYTSVAGSSSQLHTESSAKKASSLPAALAGAALPIVSSQQGGATVYTQATKRASNNFGSGIGRTTRY